MPEKEIKTKKSGWGIASDILERLSDIVLLLALLLGIYMAYDNIYLYYNIRNDNLIFQKPDTIEDAKGDFSNEVVAWLTLDDTNVDYPVMQCDDNIKYLNTSAYGDYSLAGAIFLDFRCNPDFTDSYNLIYGHHMAQNLMFGALDNFADPKYFEEHRMGTLLIGSKEIDLEINAFLQIDASDDEIFNPEMGDDIYTFIETHAKNITRISRKQNVLALSTCKEPMSTERTVLICQYRI